MDELLYEGAGLDEPVSPAPSREFPGRLNGERTLSRRLAAARYRWDSFWARHRVGAVPFLLASVLLGAAATAATVYTTGYSVRVDGYPLALVEDPAQVDQIVARVEDRASRILGYDYSLACQVECVPKTVEKRELTSLDGVETYLFNQVGEVMKTYTLSIGGETVGAFDDGERLNALLESLKAPYKTEHTTIADFTVPVTIRYEYTATSELRDLDELAVLLTSNSLEEATYEVVKGDTYIGIAKAHDMTVDQLLQMNPQATLDSLFVGDVLTVRQSVPYLSVRTVDRVSYQEAIPAPVEYVEDASMYKGDSKVVEPGSEGVAMVQANVTSVNGVEQSRNVLTSRTLVEPETKVVARGTKPRPKTAPTGHFIWPVRGVITSNYGYRSIFGSYSFHSGLDIAVPDGTSVKAADGGKVTYAGWMGTYGYLVRIDHGYGRVGYYAHNSKLLVSVGDKVYQGQVIAKSGHSGNVTGPHCHFEVRIDGKRVNPRNYLP